MVEQKKLINMANKLGKKAFLEGKKSIPVHDNNLMTLIKNKPIPAITLINAWNDGWHKENLKN